MDEPGAAAKLATPLETAAAVGGGQPLDRAGNRSCVQMSTCSPTPNKMRMRLGPRLHT